mmetsp:Transcript_18689/g.46552  ORF Transcript_18689/g.46552 Transcript_18689/m.46552 type:complete len:246 (+) Transcript_18689:164-901(+)
MGQKWESGGRGMPWVTMAALLLAACACVSVRTLGVEMAEARAEVSHLRRALLALTPVSSLHVPESVVAGASVHNSDISSQDDDSSIATSSASRQRRLLSVMASADAMAHTGASASNTFVVSSSNAATDLGAASSKAVTISPGGATAATFTSGGDLTMTGASALVKGKAFWATGGSTSNSFTASADKGPEVYILTGGVDHACETPANRGLIWVQVCQTDQDCLCFCGKVNTYGINSDGYAAYCFNP